MGGKQVNWQLQYYVGVTILEVDTVCSARDRELTPAAYFCVSGTPSPLFHLIIH